MKNPIFTETDTIRKGAGYIRNYFTGTLDTTGMTPHFTLVKRRNGEEAGTVQVSRVDAYNWTVVISRAVTSTLDPIFSYLINADFDIDSSTTIPHGVIALTIAQGVSRP